MTAEVQLQTEKLLVYCKLLHHKDLLAACDGNVSFRDRDTVWITPSGVPKAFVTASEMAQVNMDGKSLQGKPSSELSLHLEVYHRCPQAKAVVHAHPPHAIAWSVAFPERSELPIDCIGEVVLATGGIPIAPYATPGTEALAHSLGEFLPQSRAIILGRHGGLTWGESLDEAYRGMERLEHSAKILWLAHQLGPLQSLPASELEKLRTIRASLGPSLL